MKIQNVSLANPNVKIGLIQIHIFFFFFYIHRGILITSSLINSHVLAPKCEADYLLVEDSFIVGMTNRDVWRRS